MASRDQRVRHLELFVVQVPFFGRVNSSGVQGTSLGEVHQLEGTRENSTSGLSPGALSTPIGDHTFGNCDLARSRLTGLGAEERTLFTPLRLEGNRAFF